MTHITFLIVIGIMIFSIYNIYVLSTFGIPKNLSNTYYMLESKRYNFGIVYPILITIILILIFYIWLHIHSELDTEYTHIGKWLIYLTMVALSIVVAITRYQKTVVRYKTHYVAAICSSVTSVGWMLLFAQHFLYVAISMFILVGIASIITQTFRSCILYWLELVNIYSLFIVLFVLSLTL